MRLRANLAANYASQLYMAAAGLAMVPVYIASLGGERYGLVALLGVLGGIVQLLDAGMSMTLAREAAQLRAGVCDHAGFARVQRLINRIFGGVALGVGALGIAASGLIARHWLRPGALDEQLVRAAIVVMLLIVLINGVCNPYRGVLRGLERQDRLAAISGGATTLRWVLDLVVLCLLKWGVLALLAGQLLVALLEAAVLLRVSRRALAALRPRSSAASGTASAAGRVLRFALGLGFTTTVWIVATQADKLLLSRWLPLADYGVFVMATLAASGVTLLNGPIGLALMPRLTVLHARHAEDERRATYRNASRFVCALVGSAALVMAALAEPLMFAWTGDRQLAAQAAPVLAWYALGNGLLAIVALPYYLQYSAGDLRLHVRGNIVFILVLVPALWLAVRHAGALGAAWVWFGQNLFYFLIWSFVVHARFAPGLQLRWMFSDVLGTLLWPALVVSLARLAPWIPTLGRAATVLFIALISMACLLGGLAVAFRIRRLPARLDSSEPAMERRIPAQAPVAADDTVTVSVCVVTYNQGPYIRQCLDSILAQELPERLEIIVGDDASTDDTRAIVEEYVARFPHLVRLLASEVNQGAGANYFATHAQARGRLVAHIDGDDYMLPGKLRLQVEAMSRHPTCAMSVHDCLTYDQSSGRMVSKHFFRKRIGVDHHGEARLDLDFLARHLPFFAHSTKMYRRSAAVGLIYTGREMIDCHWHLYHAMRGSIVYIDRALGVYRQGIGVSHHAGRSTVLNTRLPSPYLRAMFTDAIDYGFELGVPPAPLRRSAAQTYYRWAAKFALAGQMDEFVHFARQSRQQARLGLGQALMTACIGYPGAARRLVRCGAWAKRWWRLRLVA